MIVRGATMYKLVEMELGPEYDAASSIEDMKAAGAIPITREKAAQGLYECKCSGCEEGGCMTCVWDWYTDDMDALVFICDCNYLDQCRCTEPDKED